MRSIIGTLMSMIRALARWTWTVCKTTGRLVAKLVPDFGASPAQPVTQTTLSESKRASACAATPWPDTSFEQVRELARRMAADMAKPADFKGISPAIIEWMTSLDREQLCRLVCAEKLREYINGQASVKSMPRYLEPIERPATRRTVEPEPAYRPRMAMPI